ncbi:DUF2024 family protein [Chitinophaga nivalis]|uniref:DUF2024 family protein n=1 Tax=Chitinophaga nivalis TaxID=2991709 RepID=A0ABT3IME1_9BACT|nr:DUF2024 family protein [Chitinophaga nivalis]MCW3465232.1 DUF2024 family protein [Chitinophaga nivalis]MCW3485076.1 DUF2024 family protein [Chitinophaga nivalis]
MKLAVWDTYVTTKEGGRMHFDILVPEAITDPAVVYQYGRDYLQSRHQEGQELAARECRFCHVEEATAPMVAAIGEKGYFIVEMEGC